MFQTNQITGPTPSGGPNPYSPAQVGGPAGYYPYQGGMDMTGIMNMMMQMMMMVVVIGVMMAAIKPLTKIGGE
jgi:hypothetical protein